MGLDLAAALLLAGLVASMPVFALRRRGRPSDPDVARRAASPLLGRWVREWAVWVLGPLERLLVKSGTSPTLLNFVGAGAGLAAGVAFGCGRPALAAWLLAAGGISDILDGRVARARGVVSRRGAFLDSTLDRFGETGTFVGLAWLLAGSPWRTAAVALALGGSLLVSYARARGEALGAPFGGGLLQRPERLLLLIVGGLLEPAASSRLGWAPGTVLTGVVAAVACGTAATAVHRTVAVTRALADADAAEVPE
jgi:CDP-diacylglycerol--glycerol-3-phosphate 3-phosphatidyltransferase